MIFIFFFYNDFFKSPDTITFVCITLLESLIEVGLIPSNKNYKDYFEVSNLNAFLTDVSGKVIYRSKGALEISESQKTEGKIQPVFLDENIRLSSKKLNGGYVYWFEDLKEINTINHEWTEINMQLEDENDLLEEENDIRQHAQNQQENQIGQDECPAAVLPCHPGEFPNVSDTDSAACAEKKKAQPAAEMLPLHTNPPNKHYFSRRL